MPHACPALALHSLATVTRDLSARDSEKEVLASRNVNLKDTGKYQVDNEGGTEQSHAGQARTASQHLDGAMPETR